VSVYTTPEAGEIQAFLDAREAGQMQALTGIGEGVENSNFFLDTERGRYVLTLFEWLSPGELPFYLNLMAWMAEHEIPTAHPLADRQGRYLREVLTALDWELAVSEHRFQAVPLPLDLPVGVIHADLFRNNALFEQGQLSGIIDWYYACTGPWGYDLAVAINDWCQADAEADGIDAHRAGALLAGYQQVRPLLEVELQMLPRLLRAAALRFWLSRAYDWHFPRPGDLTHSLDPEEFRQLLLWYRALNAEGSPVRSWLCASR